MAHQSKTGTLDKNNKYDRQLRLWGDHGQSFLESAKICLINASATGTEILKNCILPGVGSFTIIDEHKIEGQDIGNNFFLSADSVGKSRAQIATELISELNEDVHGNFLEENIENLIEKNPEFFSSFTVVIATQLSERCILSLSHTLWSQNVPLLICRCYGFIGYLRLVVHEHTVIESHPDNSHEDLRLDRPFQGLIEFSDSLDLSKMNKKDHSHTPWLIILYKYLQDWKKEHAGNFPKTYKEKNELKENIRKGIRKNEEGIPEDEENFDEAILNVNLALHPTTVPSEIKQLFDNPSCKNLDCESKNFWILVRALKEFIDKEGEGYLPVRGTIPDMTADSERYIQLQTVYRDQAQKDALALAGHVQSLLAETGRDEPVNPVRGAKPATIPDSDIKSFCRNAAFLSVVSSRSLEEEYRNIDVQQLGHHVIEEEEEEYDDTVLYILLRAVDRFFIEFKYYPGAYANGVEADIPKLKACLTKLLHDWGLSANIKDDYLHEMCRYGACELHTVSAFMGGVAAQEVIKIITGQFVPINNTFIYNAQRQTSTTIKL